MALSQWEIDLENNKNVINNIKKKAGGFLGSLNNPADKIAPNIYNQENTTSTKPPQQTLKKLSDTQNIKPIVNSVTPKTSIAQDNQVEPTQANTRPSEMRQITPDGGMRYVKSTSSFPAPGSTLRNAGDPANPNAVPVTLSKLDKAGNQTGITRGNGFEFQGTAEDAAKFMRPVNIGTQMVPTGRMIQAVSNSDYLPKKLNDLQEPKYLGPESGLGWKTRAKLYEAQLEAYNKDKGNQAALDIENMREAGAGLRTLAQANQWNVENTLNQQRLGLEENRIGSETSLNNLKQQREQLALDQENNINAARDAYMKDPSNENKARLNALLLDPNRQKELRPKTHVVDQYGPAGEKTGQIIVDDEGTVIYGNPEAKEHPAITWLRNNNTEEGRKIFTDKYKQLPKDWKY